MLKQSFRPNFRGAGWRRLASMLTSQLGPGPAGGPGPPGQACPTAGRGSGCQRRPARRGRAAVRRAPRRPIVELGPDQAAQPGLRLLA